MSNQSFVSSKEMENMQNAIFWLDIARKELAVDGWSGFGTDIILHILDEQRSVLEIRIEEELARLEALVTVEPIA